MDNHMHEHLAATSSGAHSHSRGTWGGHVLPGSLFCLWGAFWLLSISTRAAVHHRSHGFTFEAKTHFPTSVSRLLEVQLRTMLPLLGCFVELYAHPGDVRVRQPWDADGRWDAHSAVNYHHAAMYAAFSFSGAVDWLTARWPRAAAHVPPGVNWAALAGAFLAEAVLFGFHLRMQSGMTALLHVLLIGLVLCNASAVAAAGLMPSSVTAALLCAYFMLCQGLLFFWQARILYGPNKWDLDDGGSAMMLPVLFIGILLFCATAVLALHLAVAASPRRLALLLDVRPTHKLVASDHRDAGDEESSHAVSLRDA